MLLNKVVICIPLNQINNKYYIKVVLKYSSLVSRHNLKNGCSKLTRVLIIPDQ